MKKSTESHWQKPSMYWKLFAPPLRPNAEDLTFLKQGIWPKLNVKGSDLQRVVILGVTPEFAELPWGENTEIIAIDNSAEMIKTVWENNQQNQLKRKALLADWGNIPLEDNSCDVVLGDGCFTLLNYPDSYHQVLQEVKRILKPEGLFSMRFFLGTSESENITTIFEELETGQIANFHLFRWRLAMALQKSSTEGIPVAEIYRVWEKTISDPEQLLQKLGWSVELLNTINMYKNSPNILTFMTLEEMKKLLGFYFVELSCDFPSYQLGELFPTIIYQNNHHNQIKDREISLLARHSHGIDHITITVKDLESEIKFFRDILGFELIERLKIEKAGIILDLAIIKAGTIDFVLVRKTPLVSEHSDIGIHHIALRVDNIEQVIQDLTQRGLKFSTDLINNSGTCQIFSQRDDNSELIIELTQRKENSKDLILNTQLLFESKMKKKDDT